jgi:hypothetical protein
MKTRLFIFYLIFFAAYCQSCEPKYLNTAKRGLIQVKKVFPKEFTSHFPDLTKGDLLNLEITYPDGCYAENWCGIHLIMRFPNDEIEKYEEFCKKNSSAIYHINDSCLSIINFNPKDYKSKPVKLSLCDTLDSNHLPISNFNFFFKTLPNFNVNDEASIYVLKAEKGHFLEKENLSKKGVGLSSDWKNGYSKGIVICRKQNIAYFWLEVW